MVKLFYNTPKNGENILGSFFKAIDELDKLEQNKLEEVEAAQEQIDFLEQKKVAAEMEAEKAGNVSGKLYNLLMEKE